MDKDMKMLNKIQIKNEKASSLVEVMMATLIMVVAFSGLIQVFLTSSILSDMSGHITAAVNEAQSQIEEIRTHDYAEIVTDYASGGSPGNTFTPSMANATGLITTGTLFSEDLTYIEVQVNWTETNGRSMSTTLASFLTKKI